MEETINNAYVLGVDPGTTTGLSLIAFDENDHGKPHALWRDQLPWEPAADDAVRIIGQMESFGAKGCTIAVVAEKFQINPQTHRRGQQGAEDALGMWGVIRRACQVHSVRFEGGQTASTAKNMVNDNALRTMGLYAPGETHVNDATRHAISLALRLRIMAAGFIIGGSGRTGPLQ